jgi:basic membrane protein A
MDQSSIGPNTVLASQVYDWEKVVNRIIDLRSKGTLGGQLLLLSFADGTLELKYNAKLAGAVPQEVKDAVEKAKKEIISGSLKVGLPQKKQ